MDLLPKKLEQRFAEVGEQRDDKDPLIIAKYFDLTSVFHWYAMEYYPEDKCFWGYVKNLRDDQCSETGYFSLEELQSLKWGNTSVPLVERDLYCSEQRFSELKAEWEQRRIEQEKRDMKRWEEQDRQERGR